MRQMIYTFFNLYLISYYLAYAYSTNFMCMENNCVNPIFPAIKYNGKNVHKVFNGYESYSCTSSLTKETLKEAMPFCSHYNYKYDVAIPSEIIVLLQQDSSATGSKAVTDALRHLDKQASDSFNMHISAMGYSMWDYTQMHLLFEDHCTRSIYELTCATYFPKCSSSQKYIPPCDGTCLAYMRACDVQCCDDSIACVFDDQSKPTHLTNDIDTGYIETSKLLAVNQEGVDICTGTTYFEYAQFFGLYSYAGGSFKFTVLIIIISIILMGDLPLTVGAVGLSLSLRKWDDLTKQVSRMVHVKKGTNVISNAKKTGRWRQKIDYSEGINGVINTCANFNPRSAYDPTKLCSGNGHCRYLETSKMYYCECNEDYGGFECNIARKSQYQAYLYSLFAGVFGADRFYLGFPFAACVKLITLGGLGIWYAVDIVYIGSGNIYSASSYRLKPDLDRWFYVLVTLIWFAIIGAVFTVVSLRHHFKKKRVDNRRKYYTYR